MPFAVFPEEADTLEQRGFSKQVRITQSIQKKASSDTSNFSLINVHCESYQNINCVTFIYEFNLLYNHFRHSEGINHLQGVSYDNHPNLLFL